MRESASAIIFRRCLLPPLQAFIRATLITHQNNVKSEAKIFGELQRTRRTKRCSDFWYLEELVA